MVRVFLFSEMFGTLYSVVNWEIDKYIYKFTKQSYMSNDSYIYEGDSEEAVWQSKAERYLQDIGFDMSDIQSENHLLYASHAARIACDALGTDSMEDIRNYVLANFYTVPEAIAYPDTYLLDGMIYGYEEEELELHLKEALGEKYDVIMEEINHFIYGFNEYFNSIIT